MSHSYVGLDEYKRYGFANVATTRGDESLLFDLEAASRQLERLLGGRQFYPTIKTVYFSGNDTERVKFPSWDIISISSLKEDTNKDGVYETTWASSDYLLEPNVNDPTDPADPRPYFRIDVDTRSSGAQDIWLSGQRMYEMTGKFGFCDLTLATGGVINEGGVWSDSDTTLIVTPQSAIDVGNTLLIESEHVYVTGRTGNNYIVRRGMNGTTAASHADATAISRVVYPDNVVKAVMIQTRRLIIRNTAGFADQIGFDQTGALTPQVGVDQDFWQHVERYKRLGAY